MNTKIIHEAQNSPRDLSVIEKPAVSVSLLIFSINKGKLEVILIKRIRQPFEGFWSVPGDIISIEESLEEAALRVLHEKTGISDVYLEQLYTFGDLKRDSRGRVITIAYFALIPHNSVDLTKAPDALHARWTPVLNLPKELAFDHKKIVEYGSKRLKNKIGYSNIVQGLVPGKFRFSELQKIYEIILGEKLDKRNFRKKMTSLDIVRDTGEMYREGKHRPAKLYRFTTKNLVIYD